MGEEGKMILEQLGHINDSLVEMRADIKELKEDVSELKADVSVLKEDVSVLKEDVNGLKADVRVLQADVSGLKTDVDVLKTDMSSLKTDVTDLKNKVVDLEDGQKALHALVENDISKKITIIGEGHFFVMKALNELRGFQDEKEMMDLRILDLQIDMKRVKRYLKIA